ncbi:MAG: MarR family winged helix-turn-helix transcriptional regulator [Hyphomonadaceae bacterium]
MKSPAAHAALAGRLRPALLRVSRQVRREAQRLGVSALDAQLLAMIAKEEGAGVSALARSEQMSAPTMSAHVRRLEAAGWIARRALRGDRRRIGLAITPAGRQALEDIRRLRSDWLAERLAGLSAAEIEALRAALPALERLAGDST